MGGGRIHLYLTVVPRERDIVEFVASDLDGVRESWNQFRATLADPGDVRVALLHCGEHRPDVEEVTTLSRQFRKVLLVTEAARWVLPESEVTDAIPCGFLVQSINRAMAVYVLQGGWGLGSDGARITRKLPKAPSKIEQAIHPASTFCQTRLEPGDVPTRMLNYLSRLGVPSTIGSIVALDPNEVSSARSIGGGTIWAVQNFLKREAKHHGLPPSWDALHDLYVGNTRAATHEATGKTGNSRSWGTELRDVDPDSYEVLSAHGCVQAGRLVDDAYLKTRATLPLHVRTVCDRTRCLYLSQDIEVSESLEATLHVLPLWLLDAQVGDVNFPSEFQLACETLDIRTVADLAKLHADQGSSAGVDLEQESLRPIRSKLLSLGTGLPIDFTQDSRRDESTGLREHVDKTLEKLPSRSRTVLEARLALNGSPRKSLDEIGRSLDLTRERVRQIEQDATQSIIESCFWDDVIVLKINRILDTRREPLRIKELSAIDSWFAGFSANEAALGWVINAFSGDALHVYRIQGEIIVSRIGRDDFQEIRREVRDAIHGQARHIATRSDAEVMARDLLANSGAGELACLMLDGIAAQGEAERQLNLAARYPQLGESSATQADATGSDLAEPARSSQVAEPRSSIDMLASFLSGEISDI